MDTWATFLFGVVIGGGIVLALWHTAPQGYRPRKRKLRVVKGAKK